MKINRIKFYKNGLAFFEHLIDLEKNEASFELLFKKDQINDVIKSLTIIDPSGSTVPLVSYDSQKSGAKLLSELPINLNTTDVLSYLLYQLRGVKLRINDGKKQEGVLVGLETKKEIVSGSEVEKKLLVLMLADNSLITAELLNLKSLEVLSESVNDDLKNILEISERALKKDLRKVNVTLVKKDKKQSSKVLVSYVTEAPLWKTTYRLIIEKDKPIRIQGWIIVENTTEENWENVSLSLISGKPITFIYDLYSPQYLYRPTISLRQDVITPPADVEERLSDEKNIRQLDALEQEKSIDVVTREEKTAERGRYDDKPSLKTVSQKPNAMPMGGAYATSASTDDGKKLYAANYGTAVDRQAFEIKAASVGELFEFDLGQFSLEKNKAALIPIVSSKLSGEKISFFNETTNPTNPMVSVKIKNNSGIVLEGGPTTIIEENSYAGEGFLKTLGKDEEMYLPYAVDSELLINSTVESKTEEIFKREKVGKYVYEYFYYVQKKVYTINNKSEDEKTLFIDVPRYGELVEPNNPIETTASYWRFKVKSSPKKTEKFTVTSKYQSYYSKYLGFWARIFG